MNDDWMDELRRVDGALLPTPAGRAEVMEGVRRRRRRRAIGVGTAATVSVAAVVTAVVLLPAAVIPHDDDESPTPAPATSATALPAPNEPPTAWRLVGHWVEPAPGDCPEVSKIFDPDTAPPILDLAHQQQVVAELDEAAFKAFGVHHASPTALGVVALVTGDEAAAKRILREEYGVELVNEWEPRDAKFGLDEDGQVGQVISWQIDRVGPGLDREVRGLDGYAQIAMWQSAGGVLLSWKAPVPDEIAALAGVRPNGVRVFVEGVLYSRQDLEAARQRVTEAADSGRVDAKIARTTFCGDQSGLVVGVLPKSLGDRKAELERQFEETAGMPVTVVPGSPPVSLLQGTIDR